MNSNNIIGDISTGTTTALLKFGEKKLKELIEKFKNKQLSFINDKETIEVVKEQRKISSWKIFDKYVKDKKLRLLIQMGFALRSIETRLKNAKSNNDMDMKKFYLSKMQNLKDKILIRYGKEGLHIAEFTQEDFLEKYFGEIISKNPIETDLTKSIEEILNNIDKYVMFIQEKDNSKNISKLITSRMDNNVPNNFIITGKGLDTKKAKEISSRVINSLLTNYSHSEYEDKIKYICVLNKN